MKIQKKTPVKKAEPSVADELLKYKNLLDAGAITQEEYEQIKDNPNLDLQAQVFKDVIEEPSKMDL